MSTAGDERKLREEIARLLRGTESELRTSGLGRLARTALSAVRARRLLKLGDDVANLEALAKLVDSVGELKGTAMKVGQLLSSSFTGDLVTRPHLPERPEQDLAVHRGDSYGIVEGRSANERQRATCERRFLQRLVEDHRQHGEVVE
jgi:hypothetical protein